MAELSSCGTLDPQHTINVHSWFYVCTYTCSDQSSRAFGVHAQQPMGPAEQPTSVKAHLIWCQLRENRFPKIKKPQHQRKVISNTCKRICKYVLNWCTGTPSTLLSLPFVHVTLVGALELHLLFHASAQVEPARKCSKVVRLSSNVYMHVNTCNTVYVYTPLHGPPCYIMSHTDQH